MRSTGRDAKAVVWAHNSRIGDARFTDMGESGDELNLSQLAREHCRGEACLIDFGTHGGTVAAAEDWDGAMKISRIAPSSAGSYERLAHDSGAGRFPLDLREGVHDELRGRLSDRRPERFIGVIHQSDAERWSRYPRRACPLGSTPIFGST